MPSMWRKPRSGSLRASCIPRSAFAAARTSDSTFRAEGNVIRSLLETVQQLQSAVDALHSSLFQQVQYLALHADMGLTRATFSDWVPTFALSAEALLFALLFAVGIWLVFHALWWLVAQAGSRLLAVPH